MTCRIIFKVNMETEFGQQIVLVGNHSSMGNWNVKNGVRFTTNPSLYPQWICQKFVETQLNYNLEFQCVIIKDDHIIKWEDIPYGENRSYLTRHFKVVLYLKQLDMRIQEYIMIDQQRHQNSDSDQCDLTVVRQIVTPISRFNPQKLAEIGSVKNLINQKNNQIFTFFNISFSFHSFTQQQSSTSNQASSEQDFFQNQKGDFDSSENSEDLINISSNSEEIDDGFVKFSLYDQFKYQNDNNQKLKAMMNEHATLNISPIKLPRTNSLKNDDIDMMDPNFEEHQLKRQEEKNRVTVFFERLKNIHITEIPSTQLLNFAHLQQFINDINKTGNTPKSDKLNTNNKDEKLISNFSLEEALEEDNEKKKQVSKFYRSQSSKLLCSRTFSDDIQIRMNNNNNSINNYENNNSNNIEIEGAGLNKEQNEDKQEFEKKEFIFLVSQFLPFKYIDYPNKQIEDYNNADPTESAIRDNVKRIKQQFIRIGTLHHVNQEEKHTVKLIKDYFTQMNDKMTNIVEGGQKQSPDEGYIDINMNECDPYMKLKTDSISDFSNQIQRFAQKQKSISVIKMHQNFDPIMSNWMFQNYRYECMFLKQQEATLWQQKYRFLLDQSKVSNFQEIWNNYLAVNQKFADQLTQLMQENAKEAQNFEIVIFNSVFLMLPAFILESALKQKITHPKFKINFVFTQDFPNQEGYDSPQTQILLESLLCSDTISFSSLDSIRPFYKMVFSRLDLNPTNVLTSLLELNVNGRKIPLKVTQPGINIEEMEKIRTFITSQQKMKENPLKNINSYIFLSIDTISIKSNFDLKFDAFIAFMDHHKLKGDECKLVQIIYPNSMTQFESQKQEKYFMQELKKKAQKISGQYSQFHNIIEVLDGQLLTPEQLYTKLITSHVYLDLSLSNQLSTFSIQYLYLKKRGNLITFNTMPLLNDYEGIFRLHSEDVCLISESFKKAINRVQSTKTGEEQAQIRKNFLTILNLYSSRLWLCSILGNRGLEHNECDHHSQSLCQQRLYRFKKTVFKKEIIASQHKQFQYILKDVPKIIDFPYLPHTLQNFANASKRLFFIHLDSRFVQTSQFTKTVYIASQFENTLVVIVTDLAKEKALQIFKNCQKAILFAEGGRVVKRIDESEEFLMTSLSYNLWKPMIMKIMEEFRFQVPDTYIEVQENSLEWHFNQYSDDLNLQFQGILQVLVHSLGNSIFTEINLHQQKGFIEITQAAPSLSVCILICFLLKISVFELFLACMNLQKFNHIDFMSFIGSGSNQDFELFNYIFLQKANGMEKAINQETHFSLKLIKPFHQTIENQDYHYQFDLLFRDQIIENAGELEAFLGILENREQDKISKSDSIRLQQINKENLIQLKKWFQNDLQKIQINLRQDYILSKNYNSDKYISQSPV